MSRTIGTVYLTVADLERSQHFYQHNIGLTLHRQEGRTAVLGVGQEEMLILQEQPGARPQSGVTGLYHFAILVPNRHELGRTLRHLIETETPLGGFADHLVSEAIYLNDPDGHGIEIYRDRPEAEWPRRNGQIEMASIQLNIPELLALVQDDQTPWQGLAAGTIMGHIHLHVSDLKQAVAFYQQILGMDLITYYGRSAAFVSYNGYHHHVGLNTWAGEGAPPPPDDAPQLRWYQLRLPDAAALLTIIQRAQTHNWPVQDQGQGVFIQDPSQNRIMLTV
ncbi:MAG: VOC family protein [Anaerolineae bacterium]|nr:VOC family protein [Anaerolineae bacterium]